MGQFDFTTGVFAELPDYGLSFVGVVTTATDSTHFSATALAGKGDGFFKGYYVYPVWDAGGAGAAPQGEHQLISAYTSAGGDFVHTAFTTTLALTDKILIVHPSIARILDIYDDTNSTIPAQLEHIDFGNCVYYDSGGSAGTAYPLGTPTNPVNSMANAKDIADALNLRCIYVHGAATLAEQMEHYNFLGHGHEVIADTLDLGGQDVDGCYFEGLLVTGAQAGAGFINIKDCIVYALTNFTGMITNSAFYNSACSLEDTGYADIDYCYSIYDTVTLTVQAPTRASIKDWKGNLILTAQDGGTMLLRGFIGTLEIDAMTAGTLSVYASGADITINGDCSGGTINLYGNAQITGAGGGVTINNYLIDTKVDTLVTRVTAAVATEAKQDTIDTVVDGIQTDLSNTTDGLGALKTLIDILHGGVAGVQDIKEALDAQLDTARGKYTKTMTSGEDDLYGESSDTEFRLEEFRVDLHNMAVGDTIIFRAYTTEDGTERKISHDESNTFIDAQDPARVEIVSSASQVWGREDISITAEQTAGTNREIVCYWRDSKRGS